MGPALSCSGLEATRAQGGFCGGVPPAHAPTSTTLTVRLSPKPPGRLKESNGSSHTPAVEAEMPLGLENPTCGAMATRELRREASVATTSGNSPHGPDPHRGASTRWVAPPMYPGYLLPWAVDGGPRVPSFLHTAQRSLPSLVGGTSVPTHPRLWPPPSAPPSTRLPATWALPASTLKGTAGRGVAWPGRGGV